MKLYLDYNLTNGDNNLCYVFLHGWGMKKEYFDKIISQLDVNGQILSLDFFGFGNSTEPKEYFDTYEYAYYIYLKLKKLNIKSIVLIGHSFGGRIAILLSSLFDIDVKALILTSSAGINYCNVKNKLKILRYKFCKTLVKLKLLKKDRLNKFGSADYKNCNEVMKSVFVKVVNQDLRKHLKNIKCNTILVWDKKDKETPYIIAKILYKNINNSKIINYKNGGHFVFLYNISKFSQLIDNVV